MTEITIYMSNDTRTELKRESGPTSIRLKRLKWNIRWPSVNEPSRNNLAPRTHLFVSLYSYQIRKKPFFLVWHRNVIFISSSYEPLWPSFARQPLPLWSSYLVRRLILRVSMMQIERINLGTASKSDPFRKSYFTLSLVTNSLIEKFHVDLPGKTKQT